MASNHLTYLGFTLSNKGGQNLVTVSGDANGSIRIAVQETANRCPSDYRSARNAAGSTDQWSAGAGAHLYTKIMD